MGKIDKYTKKILENKDKYIIFYSDWCGYCENALKLLKKHNLSFKGYKIDKIEGGINTLLKNLKKTKHITNFDPNHKSRPIIFKYGKYLGGCDILVNKLK